MATVLSFRNVAIFVKIFAYFYVNMQNFGEVQMICSRVIAYFRFSKWRPSAILDWYDVIVDHPRLVFDGPNILLKLHVDRFLLCKIS